MRIWIACVGLGLVVGCGETITNVPDAAPALDSSSDSAGDANGDAGDAQIVDSSIDQGIVDLLIPDLFVPDLPPIPCPTPCDDAIDCTEDKCIAGKCVSTIKADFCLIDNSCYATGAAKAGNECQHCDATISTTSFSDRPKGDVCTDDGISCTDDICEGGACTHPLALDTCYVSGSCYNKDELILGVDCALCRPELKTTLGSLGSGLACDDKKAETFLDICLGGSCKGFLNRPWELNQVDADYVVTSVANVPVHGLWMGVAYTGTFNDPAGATDGAMKAIHGAGECSLYPWVPGCPGMFGGLTTFYGYDGGIRSVFHRLAVGDKGQAKHFKNLTATDDSWNLLVAQDIVTHLGPSANARSVWGGDFNGGVERYFIATNGGVSDCSTTDQGTTFTCTDTTGLPIGTEVHKVFGNKTIAGDLGNVWVLRSNSFEDIYAYDAQAKSWSNSTALGCIDTPGTPCGDSLGRFTDLWVDDKGEAWAVGEKGLIVRFDGAAWKRVLVPSLGIDQSKYNFRGVYAAEDLLLMVGERKLGTDVDFFLMSYNIAYDAWYPAQIVFSVDENDPNLEANALTDIAGRGIGPIGIVGSRWRVDPVWPGQGEEQKPFTYYLK